MNARPETISDQSYVLEISRVLDAPQELVFKMWTSPEHLARWWGPKDFTATTQIMEFRRGGRYRHTIHAPNGDAHGMSGVYHEIVAPSRIVFDFAWDDDNGAPDNQYMITATFAAEGERTRLIFRQEPFADRENRDSHLGGWGECLDRLEQDLARR